jgi:hypothetical protein
MQERRGFENLSALVTLQYTKVPSSRLGLLDFVALLNSSDGKIAY